MFIAQILSSNSAKASASTSAVAVVQNFTDGTIEVAPWLYTGIAVALGLIGVYLARLVTIDAENKRLGRVQTYRETGPLTWIGVLIVCPFIWHYSIAIPWASMIGLGVGYSVRVVLKIFGSAAVDVARSAAQRAAATLAQDRADEKREDTALDEASRAQVQPPAPRLDAPGARPPAVILPPDKPDVGLDGLMNRLRSPDDPLYEPPA